VVAAVHGEGTFGEPGAGIEPNPGVQQAGAVSGEAETAGGDAKWVYGAQWWAVAGHGLVEVDGHRSRRGDLAVGGGTRDDSSQWVRRIEHMIGE